MRRVMWTGLGVCCLLVALPIAGANTNDDSSIADVRVDLAGRLFEQTLPFDVPFTINGEVPAGTRRVEVQYIGRRQPFTVAECDSDADDNCTPSCADYAKKDGAAESCRWQPLSGPIVWERVFPPPTDDPASFRVPLPPLEASSYYRFRIGIEGPLGNETLQRFQSRVQEVLGELLAKVKGGDATKEANEQLRKAMVSELEDVAGPGLKIADKSLFDLGIAYDDLSDKAVLEFNDLVGSVLQAQSLVERNLTARSREQPQLQANLATIASSGPLDELIQALVAQGARQPPTATSGLVQELMKRHANALALADLTAHEQANLALGLTADTGGLRPTLTELSDPEAAGTFAMGYLGSVARLAQLEEWLGSLVGGGNRGLLTQAVSASGALTDQDVSDLGNLLPVVQEARQRASALANFASQVETQLRRKSRALASLSLQVRVQAAADSVRVDSSTVSSFSTQQRWYIGGDFGFLYGPEIGEAVPYFGTNIYFRPVNKDAPLSVRGGFLRRFSVTLGATVKSIADDSPKSRDDLFDSNSLLVGVGYRVTDSARLGLGALVFRKEDPNPLIDEQKVTVSPYLSLSFDIDVLSFFQRLSGVFTPQE